MSPTSDSNNPRFWTVAQRREAFLRFKQRETQTEAAMRSALDDVSASMAPTLDEVPPNCEAQSTEPAVASTVTPATTEWYVIEDNNMPIDPLPRKHAQNHGRSVDLWVRYYHVGRHEEVVALGHMDFEGCGWVALRDKTNDEDRPYWEVRPLAWAYIAEGIEPWDGLVLT